jgi:hypothetical protein
MKKNRQTITSVLMINFIFNAQVGINTSNSHAAFHIDAVKDNPPKFKNINNIISTILNAVSSGIDETKKVVLFSIAQNMVCGGFENSVRTIDYSRCYFSNGRYISTFPMSRQTGTGNNGLHYTLSDIILKIFKIQNNSEVID